MTTRPGSARILFLVAALSAVGATGCSLFRSSPGMSSETSAGLQSSRVVLTARGATTLLRGDTASLSRAVEDMFENLEIYLVGEQTIDGEKEIRGQAGTTEIFVDLEPRPGRRMEVSVRVRERGSGSRGRWDRLAGRGLLEEIRRWAAQ